MALEIRPNRECCDVDLPPHSLQARICTFECTFCATCVETVLHNACPNRGGGFQPRPIRPRQELRPGISLATRPASTRRVHLSYTLDEVAAVAELIKAIPAEER
jgi:hypothetical protein